ncbi:MAG: hypothetical protein ACD_20C00108G0008 [uncultured bacterium]|nr:MAG: hypothetical protein ACD_20C00108G0008 [uncultured bacterium]
MKHILIKFEFNESMDKEKIDYDLYNIQGEIVYKRGQKIDSEFLEMLKNVNLYKKDTTIDESEQDIYKREKIAEYTRELLLLGIKKKASDIQIETSENRGQIRFLVNGVLHEEIKLEKNFTESLIDRLTKLANLSVIAEKYQKGSITISLFNRAVEFQFSSLSTTHGEKAILQIAGEKKERIPGLPELCFSHRIFSSLLPTIEKKRGLFFVIGPVQSGKTTTIYSLLKYLKECGKNIITVEESIKYQIPGVNQIQKKFVRNEGYNTFFYNLLNHNPDVAMLKSNNDKELIETALQAATNCNFIIESTSNQDTLQFLTDLINGINDPKFLGTTFTGILAQKLVRKICDHCKEESELSPKEIDKLFLWDEITKVTLYKGKGCPHCDNTGYLGYIPVYEQLIINDELQKLIIKRATVEEIQAQLKKNSFQDIKHDGMKKVLRGLTTLEEINAVSQKNKMVIM